MILFFLGLNFIRLRGRDVAQHPLIALQNALILGTIGGLVWVFVGPAMTDFFSLQKTFYLLPFFMAGYVWNAIEKGGEIPSATSRVSEKVSAVVILVCLLLLGFVFANGDVVFSGVTRRGISVFSGIFAAILFSLSHPKAKSLLGSVTGLMPSICSMSFSRLLL